MAMRTQKAIHETFEKMLDEMPFEKITVSELAKRCEISPNTFYYHYEDIYDLLKKWFKTKRDIWKNEDWKASYKNFLDYSQNNKRKIFHIYNSLSRDYLERMVFKYFDELLRKDFEIDGNYIITEETIDFVLYSLVGTYLKFIWNDLEGNTSEIVYKLSKMLDGYVDFYLNKNSR